MSRQLDAKQEQRAAKRRLALERALDYGIPGAIEMSGGTLLGFTVRYDSFDCLIVLKAAFGKDARVCFVGSDTLTNCILKCERDASHDRLKWVQDKYAKKDT